MIDLDRIEQIVRLETLDQAIRIAVGSQYGRNVLQDRTPIHAFLAKMRNIYVRSPDLSSTLALLQKTGILTEDVEPKWNSIREIVCHYLQSCHYLESLFHEFGTYVIEQCQHYGVQRIVFLLRDGLVFIPPIMKIAQGSFQFSLCWLNMNIYKQLLTTTSESARFSILRSLFDPPLSSNERCAYVDTGTYGRLIAILAESRILNPQSLVIYLVSQNPNLNGWFNHRQHPIVTNSIALLDSVEALVCPIHPVRLRLSNDNPSTGVYIEPLDTLSQVLSYTMLWKLYHPELMINAESASAHWYLEEPIPSWQARTQFLASWRYGKILPLEGSI